jgi:hypothetical protein
MKNSRWAHDGAGQNNKQYNEHNLYHSTSSYIAGFEDHLRFSCCLVFSLSCSSCPDFDGDIRSDFVADSSFWSVFAAGFSFSAGFAGATFAGGCSGFAGVTLAGF